MPHLSIQYSSNLDRETDIAALCKALLDVIAARSIFPLGGIRVRAFPAEHYAIADLHPDNAFADMVFRIGAGRSTAQKAEVGAALMAAAEHHFAAQLARPHFALSLEIIDITPDANWKTNSIHPRLKGAA